MITRREKADYFLYECGLLEELRKYGRPHVIGSYKMDMMAWNDLDIDIENSNMSLDKLYELTTYILETFKPTWYEAKEEVNDEGKTVWFHGFETMISGELWNFDLWFFDQETIDKAEKFCDDIVEKAKRCPNAKNIITELKHELITRGIYSFDEYHSMDVYKAVLEQGIKDIETFLREYKR